MALYVVYDFTVYVLVVCFIVCAYDYDSLFIFFILVPIFSRTSGNWPPGMSSCLLLNACFCRFYVLAEMAVDYALVIRQSFR